MKYCCPKCVGTIKWKGGISYYRGKDWKKQRLKVLKLDNYTCQNCLSKQKLTIHHIIPYRETYDNSPQNLVTLCRSCHGKTELEYEKPLFNFTTG